MDECIVNTKYKLNRDGYFRKNVKGKLVMFHRHVYELNNGDIPEGFSVHHKCENRACYNIEHLELISKSKHATLHNKERNIDRFVEAMLYLNKNKEITGTKLAEIFKVSFSMGCRWKRIYNTY